MDPVKSNGGGGFLNKLLGVYVKGTRIGHRIREQKGLGELCFAGRKLIMSKILVLTGLKMRQEIFITPTIGLILG